jgi:hypothetical protein
MPKTINLYHQKMTEETAFNNVKALYKKYPELCMEPNRWKRLHDKVI